MAADTIHPEATEPLISAGFGIVLPDGSKQKLTFEGNGGAPMLKYLLARWLGLN